MVRTMNVTRSRSISLIFPAATSRSSAFAGQRSRDRTCAQVEL